MPVLLAEGWGGVEAEAAGMGATIDKTMDRTIDRLQGSLKRTRTAKFGGRAYLPKSFRESIREVDADIAPPAQIPPAAALFDAGGSGLLDLSRERSDDTVNLSRNRDQEQDQILEEISAKLSAGASRPEDRRATDVLAILSLQFVDGSFGWSRILHGIFHSLGLDAERWRAALEPLLPKSPPSSKSGDAVSTVAILLLLAIRFPEQEPLWQRAGRKASREYLPSALNKSPAEIESLLTDLRGHVPR